jgi:hypothetical protein
MRLILLALALLTLSTGCRSHIHAGGGQGFDAGASIGRAGYAPPVVVSAPPPTIDVPPPVQR